MTMTMDPKIACIGAGYWGKNLVRNFHALGRLSSVCETSPERWAELAAAYSDAHLTDSVEEVLADPQVAGVAIGQYAFIGAGAVVLKDVPDYALVVGNPGRIAGWMCIFGNRIESEGEEGQGRCRDCGRAYRKAGQKVSLQ